MQLTFFIYICVALKTRFLPKTFLLFSTTDQRNLLVFLPSIFIYHYSSKGIEWSNCNSFL